MQYYESTVKVELVIHATYKTNINIWNRMRSKRAGENRIKFNLLDKNLLFFYFYKDAKPKFQQEGKYYSNNRRLILRYKLLGNQGFSLSKQINNNIPHNKNEHKNNIRTRTKQRLLLPR